MKVAKLVTLSYTTRVIVEASASDVEISIAAQNDLRKEMRENIVEFYEEIEDDLECPYDPEGDEPNIPELSWKTNPESIPWVERKPVDGEMVRVIDRWSGMWVDYEGSDVGLIITPHKDHGMYVHPKLELPGFSVIPFPKHSTMRVAVGTLNAEMQAIGKQVKEMYPQII